MEEIQRWLISSGGIAASISAVLVCTSLVGRRVSRWWRKLRQVRDERRARWMGEAAGLAVADQMRPIVEQQNVRIDGLESRFAAHLELEEERHKQTLDLYQALREHMKREDERSNP